MTVYSHAHSSQAQGPCFCQGKTHLYAHCTAHHLWAFFAAKQLGCCGHASAASQVSDMQAQFAGARCKLALSQGSFLQFCMSFVLSHRWLPPEVFVLTCAFDTLERERAAVRRQSTSQQSVQAGPDDDRATDPERPEMRERLWRALRFPGMRWRW